MLQLNYAHSALTGAPQESLHADCHRLVARAAPADRDQQAQSRIEAILILFCRFRDGLACGQPFLQIECLETEHLRSRRR